MLLGPVDSLTMSVILAEGSRWLTITQAHVGMFRSQQDFMELKWGQGTHRPA